MSIVHVQDLPVSTVASSTSFTTSNFGSSVTTGNTILVGVVVWKGSAVSTSNVQDSQGNGYTQDLHVAYSSNRADVSVWRASNVTGGASFDLTITPSAATGIVVFAAEFSGLANSSPLDGAGSTNTYPPPTTNAWGTGAYSTTNANDLLIALYGIDSTQSSITPNSSPAFTSAGTNLSGIITAGEFDWCIVAATQTNVNPTATGSANSAAGCVGLAYKQAAAGASVQPPIAAYARQSFLYLPVLPTPR